MNYQELTVSDWINKCHRASVAAGWWHDGNRTDPMVHAVKIALIHSEISEALEGLRKGTRDAHLTERLAVEVELADAVIRILDLAGAMELDIEGAMIDKMAYNKSRMDHKPEHRAATGGKKF